MVPRLAGGPLPTRLRTAAALLLGVTAIVVCLIVFTPGPPDPEGQVALQVFVDRGHAAGWLPELVTFGLVEWLANVVMFLPLGFFAAGVVPGRHRVLVIPGAVVASTGIELAQLWWLPSRVASLADVLANGIGGSLGLLLLIFLSARRLASPAPTVVT